MSRNVKIFLIFLVTLLVVDCRFNPDFLSDKSEPVAPYQPTLKPALNTAPLTPAQIRQDMEAEVHQLVLTIQAYKTYSDKLGLTDQIYSEILKQSHNVTDAQMLAFVDSADFDQMIQHVDAVHNDLKAHPSPPSTTPPGTTNGGLGLLDFNSSMNTVGVDVKEFVTSTDINTGAAMLGVAGAINVTANFVNLFHGTGVKGLEHAGAINRANFAFQLSLNLTVLVVGVVLLSYGNNNPPPEGLVLTSYILLYIDSIATAFQGLLYLREASIGAVQLVKARSSNLGTPSLEKPATIPKAVLDGSLDKTKQVSVEMEEETGKGSKSTATIGKVVIFGSLAAISLGFAMKEMYVAVSNTTGLGLTGTKPTNHPLISNLLIMSQHARNIYHLKHLL